jgi:FAD synthase
VTYSYSELCPFVLANYPESVVENLPAEMPLGVYYGWGNVDDGEVYKMVLSVGWNLYYKNTKKSMVRKHYKNTKKSMVRKH